MAPLPILKSTIILDLLCITDSNYMIISHDVTVNDSIDISIKRVHRCDLQTAYVAYFLIAKITIINVFIYITITIILSFGNSYIVIDKKILVLIN